MKTSSAFAVLVACVASFTVALPTGDNPLPGTPVRVRSSKFMPRFTNDTAPPDETPRPILVPADTVKLRMARDTLPSRKSFTPHQAVEERDEQE
ncbi:hypothetical protein B0T10DRAFT_479542 [Thelonectria olida]|uniref:Uncharacterized protein n=1 Tax=Thelonectria olida TaxID=1576542 RepID=A0A9P9ASP8_9HYPO|nr:hypothetical protein B0T10DRAFT_479542 [Thelonectria olida]